MNEFRPEEVSRKLAPNFGLPSSSLHGRRQNGHRRCCRGRCKPSIENLVELVVAMVAEPNSAPHLLIDVPWFGPHVVLLGTLLTRRL
jgi:hypothetical protein